MKKKSLFLFGLALVLYFGSTASAITAEEECHSGGTSWDGDTSSCHGEVCVTAYQLNPLTAVVTQTNGYGGKHDCDAPRIAETAQDGWNTRVIKMCAGFGARSPSGAGNAGKRGTVRCHLSVDHRDAP